MKSESMTKEEDERRATTADLEPAKFIRTTPRMANKPVALAADSTPRVPVGYLRLVFGAIAIVVAIVIYLQIRR